MDDLEARLGKDFDQQKPAEKLARIGETLSAEIAVLPQAEKIVAASLLRRDAFTLSRSLAPLLGEQRANLVFGIGIFGMGFSTIIILMLINGFAFSEMANDSEPRSAHIVGCLVAGVAGALWFLVWEGDTQFWLAIIASSFGMMLLPIAYFTFWMMMNNSNLMGESKPSGLSAVIWNVLMAISVAGACAAAGAAIYENASNKEAGKVVIGVAAVYLVLVVVGFGMIKKPGFAHEDTPR